VWWWLQFKLCLVVFVLPLNLKKLSKKKAVRVFGGAEGVVVVVIACIGFWRVVNINAMIC